jgi:hypothetical protein
MQVRKPFVQTSGRFYTAPVGRADNTAHGHGLPHGLLDHQHEHPELGFPEGHSHLHSHPDDDHSHAHEHASDDLLSLFGDPDGTAAEKRLNARFNDRLGLVLNGIINATAAPAAEARRTLKRRRIFARAIEDAVEDALRSVGWQ